MKWSQAAEGRIDEEDTKAHREWVKIRRPIIPEPVECMPIDYNAKHRIRDVFKNRGIQVIIKMASIELTPDKPEFPEGSWHVEGQMNEHIAATALFYVDSENITPSRLAFRQPTNMYQSGDYDYAQVGLSRTIPSVLNLTMIF